QQLVVAGAAELLAAHAPLRGGVAVAGTVGRGAMPQGAVAAGQITLSRRRVIGGRMEAFGLLRATALRARRRRHAALALAVVQRADDDGPVDIVFDELQPQFLADARQDVA